MATYTVTIDYTITQVLTIDARSDDEADARASVLAASYDPEMQLVQDQPWLRSWRAIDPTVGVRVTRQEEKPAHDYDTGGTR